MGEKKDEKPQEEHHNKLADAWHHLEDMTGGRAEIPQAGDQQTGNFEHITDHEDAEHH